MWSYEGRNIVSEILAVFFISLVFLSGTSYAILAKVNVQEEIEGDIKSVEINYTNPVRFLLELHNTGSLPYGGRMRVDVFKDDKIVFTGWGPEHPFMPIVRKSSAIYWFLDKNEENYTTRVRAYIGGEIVEKNVEIDSGMISAQKGEDVFEISNFRAYDDHIIFDVSIKNVSEKKEVVVIPDKYPRSWIFEQAEMEIRGRKTVVLDYKAGAFLPVQIDLYIASVDGKYASKRTVKLDKEKGYLGILYFLADQIRMRFA